MLYSPTVTHVHTQSPQKTTISSYEFFRFLEVSEFAIVSFFSKFAQFYAFVIHFIFLGHALGFLETTRASTTFDLVQNQTN